MKEKIDEILYLCARDVEQAGVSMELAIACVEKVLSLHDKNMVILPSKVILDMDERRNGRINAMPAYVGGETNMCGIKWIAGFPNNPSRYGLPRAHALIVLNDPSKGLPVCILEGTKISALRTGAVTGVGARYLARPDSKILALIGGGVQAWTQLEAVLQILKEIKAVRIYDVWPAAAESFKERAKKRWPSLSVIAARNPEQAIQGADVVITVTTADEPIVKENWLKPGVFFAHVGSYQEEEEAVISQADKIVVDIWEEVLHRGTPLLAQMYRAGLIDDSRIHANIGQIINGKKPGRQRDDERIFFSPLGLGSEDIAVATEIYRKALSQGLGIGLPYGVDA